MAIKNKAAINTIVKILGVDISFQVLWVNIKNHKGALAGVAQLVGALSHGPMGHGFNSQSGHMPRHCVREGN